MAPKVSKAAHQAGRQARAQYAVLVAPHAPPKLDDAAHRAVHQTRRAARQAADYAAPRMEQAVAAAGPLRDEAVARSAAALAALRGQVTAKELRKLVRKHERRAKAKRTAKGVAVAGLVFGGAVAAWKWWREAVRPGPAGRTPGADGGRRALPARLRGRERLVLVGPGSRAGRRGERRRQRPPRLTAPPLQRRRATGQGRGGARDGGERGRRAPGGSARRGPPRRRTERTTRQQRESRGRGRSRAHAVSTAGDERGPPGRPATAAPPGGPVRLGADALLHRGRQGPGPYGAAAPGPPHRLVCTARCAERPGASARPPLRSDRPPREGRSPNRARSARRRDDCGAELLDHDGGHDSSLSHHVGHIGLGDLHTFLMMCPHVENGGSTAVSAQIFR